MYPLVFSIIGAALLALALATTIPADAERLTRTQADAYAANFWTFRQALVAYQNDHYYQTNGCINVGTLSNPFLPTRPRGYLPVGFELVPTPDPCGSLWWSHRFQGGRLYTFTTTSATQLPAGVVDAIANRNGRSLMIGIRQGATIKTLFELSVPPYTATGTIYTAFPSDIPDGALVVIGN